MRIKLYTLTLFTFGLMISTVHAGDMRLHHVVKSGDSLSALAVAYKTDVETLLKLNGKRSEKIVIGSRIEVPWPTTELSQSTDLRAAIHEVIPGDSLGSIALLYKSDAQCIRLLNALPNDKIRIGQRLKVPTHGPELVRTPFVYNVMAGDTLAGIARKHDLPTIVLRYLNPEANWRQLKIGQGVNLIRWETREIKVVEPVVVEQEPAPVLPMPEFTPVPAPVPAPEVSPTTLQKASPTTTQVTPSQPVLKP